MAADSERQEMLLTQRYGDQPKPANVAWNDMVEAMLRHRSVRSFLAEPLPEGCLETMVAAAQSASSASSLHQWSVVAVTDPALQQRLADTIARTVPTDRIPSIEEASVLLLWVADVSRSVGITKERGGDPVVTGFLDAFLMASVDVALAAQNASLAAESMGLGIVFLGVMRNAAKEVAEMINLPPHSFVTFGMAVGRPDPERPNGIRPRPAQGVVLHHNRYDQDAYRQYVDGYETVFRKFREERGMKMQTWQEAVHHAATSMEYMGGRENLRDMVTNRGFRLR